jgi:hypothetical protein
MSCETGIEALSGGALFTYASVMLSLLSLGARPCTAYGLSNKSIFMPGTNLGCGNLSASDFV